MDLLKIIHDLQEERKKLDLIIASLEQLEGSTPIKTSGPTGRRGRRFMNAEGRLEVSRRMKKYWESRRNQTLSADSDTNGHAASGAAGG